MAGDRVHEPDGVIIQWLRSRATLKMFMVIYSLLGTVQAMSYIYITVTLTTLEKRFKIPSQTTGIILSGNEISQVLSILLVYYGGSGHRPRWIAVGVGCSALSCLILALPHFIYGPGRDALALTQEYLDHTLLNATINSEDIFLCQRIPGPPICDEDTLSDISLIPRLLVFMSQFILGIGTTLYYGLGQTYLDDNTEKKNTPMLLGVSFGLRTLGPVAGFILSYLCLKIYIQPKLHPVISPEDPRWLGAWWLGWIILAIVMGLFSLLVAVFPKEIPKTRKVLTKDGETPLRLDSTFNKKTSTQQEVINPVVESRPKQIATLKEFPKVFKRILTNRIILFNNISGVFYVLGASGFITFFPKFIEVQFGTSSGGGSVLAGPITLFGMVLGFLLSGAVISKFKPGARPLLAWNVMVGFCFLFGMIGYTFLACPDRGIEGIDINAPSYNLTFECNADCACEGIKYSPVCHEASGRTFFSACHAGCKTVLDDHKFGNCTCASSLKMSRSETDSKLDDLDKGISNSREVETSSGELRTRTLQPDLTIDDKVISGPCPRDCKRIYSWFVGISCVIQMIACAGKIGNILVNYRAVAPEDKSVAQGFTLMVISLFALIPGPIIYGAVIDATCIVWDQSCGENGNCWFYHKDNFRYYMCISGAGFILVAVIFDSMVWYLVKDLDLYGATDEDKRREFIKPEIPVTSNETNKPGTIGAVNSDQRHEQNS